jgi:hypothetical protein
MNIFPFFRGVVAVTKSDTTVFAAGVGLYVGGAGDVAIKCENGTSATLVGVPAGSFIPGRIVQVLSTGTTATDIVALY